MPFFDRVGLQIGRQQAHNVALPALALPASSNRTHNVAQLRRYSGAENRR